MNEMEVITHLNVTVGYFPFTKIQNIEIYHVPGNFGTCVITGQMDSQTAVDIARRTDETRQTEVITTAQGQPRRLFFGIVANVAVSHLAEYAQVIVTLLDTCKLLDITPHQCSYQNTSLTYGDLIVNCMAGEGTSMVTVTDQKTGTLVVQYNETNWAFSQRMASQLSAPVVSDIKAEVPNLYVGLPPSDQTINLTSSTFSFGKSALSDSGSRQQVSEDSSDMGVESCQYTFIGNFAQVGESFYTVKSVAASMADGILNMKYGLLPIGNETPTTSTAPSLGGLSVPAMSNQGCSGKMLSGTVMAVAGNKVQVQFAFDGGFDSNHWFEYSTAYSSSDQSGWYCMPEEGDTVRVFFPSGSEGEAFAASSATKFALENPKNKCWMAHGKQIVLTEKTINIACDEGEVVIDLSTEDGITIFSKQNISINAAAGLYVQAGTIMMSAEDKIAFGTDRAFIDISDGKITLLGNTVAVE